MESGSGHEQWQHHQRYLDQGQGQGTKKRHVHGQLKEQIEGLVQGQVQGKQEGKRPVWKLRM